MGAIQARMAGVPIWGRYAVVGGTSAGAAGALAGLVIGLLVYPPTAAFAVLELGLPAAVVGGVVGLAAGFLLSTLRRMRRSTA
jgi:hypothetical protein